MPSQTTPRLPPRRDSLDDEQALARTDVADPPRFSPRGLEARRDREPLLQAGLRRTQLLHLGALCGKRVPRLEVRGERPVVEVDGETDRGDDPDEAHSPTRAQPGSPLRLSNPRVPLCALAHAAGFHPAARSPPAARRVAFLSRLGRRWQRRRGRGPQGSTGGTSKARGRSILPPAASAQPGGGLCPPKGLRGQTRRVPVASGASLAKEARPRAAGQYRWYEQGPRPKHPAASGVSAARRRALPAERATRPDASGSCRVWGVAGKGGEAEGRRAVQVVRARPEAEASCRQRRQRSPEAGFARRKGYAARRVGFLSRLGRRWQRRRGRGPQGSTGGTSKARGRSILPPAASAQPGGGLCPPKGLRGQTRRVPVASGASLAKEARPRAAGQYRWYEQGPRSKHPAASGVSAARRQALPAERATRP